MKVTTVTKFTKERMLGMNNKFGGRGGTCETFTTKKLLKSKSPSTGSTLNQRQLKRELVKWRLYINVFIVCDCITAIKIKFDQRL